ncbi:MAG: Crp/Fnr family transcriptional regulator [Lutibacter sp.]|nr:MAG: Crp/Fnr family transcriptional regulator [Lutibacter sp.]
MKNCQQCIIKELNSLKTLNNEELLSITDCKTTLSFKRGDVIFGESENINGVFCIRQGVCKISKMGINGKDQIINFIGKGNLLGQRSVIADEATNLKATSMTDMDVCFIPKKEIINNLTNNSKFSLSVLKNMSNALKETDNHIVDLAQKPVKIRMAETLLYIYDNFGVDDDGMLSVILTRDDYANIVGTATESAIRILSQFKKDGLITTEGKKIKIIDQQGLLNQ